MESHSYKGYEISGHSGHEYCIWHPRLKETMKNKRGDIRWFSTVATAKRAIDKLPGIDEARR